jgi:hypothetical protein
MNDPETHSENNVSVFANAYQTKPSRGSTIQELISEIKSGEYRKQIEKIRATEDKASRDKLKAKLPGATFSGAFYQRKIEGLKTPSCVIVADCDHLKNISLAREIMKGDPETLCLFASPYDGLKVGVKTDGITSDADHKRFFDGLRQKFDFLYDIKIDESCKDISRLTFLSYDPDAYFNEDAEKFNIDAWVSEQEPLTEPEIKCDYSTSNENYILMVGRKILENDCQAIRESQPHSQHTTRLKRSMRVGGYIATGAIIESEAIQALENAVKDSGAKDLRKANKDILDGIKYGKCKPLHVSINQTEQVQADEGLKKLNQIAPKIPFPWEIFPESIQISMKQLGRATASSAYQLAIVCLALIAAAVGRVISVQAKQNWVEPLILWLADVRASGDGKTGGMQQLAKPLRDRQKIANDFYESELDEYNALPKKEREKQPPPKPARGYFVSNLTLEGLRVDLKDHLTGGIAILYNELSEMISCQNQYKSKGSDREAWIALHDGYDARIIRAQKTLYIHGARPQIIGGIQPQILSHIFNNKDSEGLFLNDGTVFRFLFTYEESKHYPLTTEYWTGENQRAWETVLSNALAFGDHGGEVVLKLSPEAQKRFIEWRNHLDAHRPDMPPEVRGFFPKIYGYCLRLSGLLYLMDQFANSHFALNKNLNSILMNEYIEKGIFLSMYFLSQVSDIINLIKGNQIDIIKNKIIESLKEGDKSLTELYKVFQNHIKSNDLHNKLNEMVNNKEIIEKLNNKIKIYSMRICETANLKNEDDFFDQDVVTI